jgi:hypothetical protein
MDQLNETLLGYEQREQKKEGSILVFRVLQCFEKTIANTQMRKAKNVSTAS